MKKLSLLLVFLFIIGSLPVSGFAESPWTKETTYQGKMMGKLGFGVKNLLLGWTELFKKPAEHYHNATEQKPIHLLEGVVDGIGTFVADTIGGALHVVTFPITNLDVPLPGDGVECPLKHESK